MMSNLSSRCNSWKNGTKLWQMYRCHKMKSIKWIEHKLTAMDCSYRDTKAPVLHRNANSMVTNHRLGILWGKSLMLPTMCLRTGLQSQRAYVTMPKHDRFDKFGRLIDTRPKNSSKARSVAKEQTARVHEAQTANSKRALNLNLKNRLQSIEKTTARSRRKCGYYERKPMEQSIIKRPHKQQIAKNRSDSKYKSEQEGLKYLLSDLLNTKPQLQSTNYEYVKCSPIFKLIKRSAEHRNSLRAGGFQKQLEIPTIFKHPLGKTRKRKIIMSRCINPTPSEKQKTEKRSKSAQKMKLCLLLLDHKDQDDDDDK